MYLVEKTTKGEFIKVYLTGSGSDAMEGALKLARQSFFDQDPKTSRKYVISRDHSYHGNTLGALSISEFTSRQAPYKDILLKDIVKHVSSCYTYRQLLEGESIEDFVAKKVEELEKKFQELGPENVMAVVLEPVSGAALGCAVPPPGYLEGMNEVAHKHGAIVIYDEVMCGMGRTGFTHA